LFHIEVQILDLGGGESLLGGEIFCFNYLFEKKYRGEA